MATVDKEAIKRLHNLSECCICLMTYTDPRTLPCFHTACLECFEDIQSKNGMKAGDVLPCPLCRKEFTIPPEGMKGLQKNFFIESLMEVTKSVNLKRKALPCNTCQVIKEGSDVTEATMRCLNCCECYCLTCSKMHKSQKLARDHKIIEINRGLNEEETRNMGTPLRYCKRHFEKTLDYYCSDCKTVVCVSCFVEDHKLHKCKDVTTVDKDFRHRVEESSVEMLHYSREMLSKKMDMENQRKKFLEKTLKIEKAIRTKNQQLKSLIDRHTQDVLNELSLLSQMQQNTMEREIEEIDMKITVIESFVTYSSEMKSKGSPSEVCECAENLITRAKELNKENEEFLNAPRKVNEIEFIETDQKALLHSVHSVIGQLSKAEKDFCSCAVVIGDCDGHSTSRDVIMIKLNRLKDVFNLQQIPTQMRIKAAAAVYCNSIFVTGVGINCDEIWRLEAISSYWKKCASLVQGRQCHSMAFVDHVLYICGGYVESDCTTLDDVEAYDTIDDNCATVGKLYYAVESAGNCVPFKSSLYIFGGFDDSRKAVRNVQVYNTELNTCFLLSKVIPKIGGFLRVALWENSAILLGWRTSFLYDFDTGTWETRDQFKTDVANFDLTIYNGKIFVIGECDWANNAGGRRKWFPRDDVRYIPVTNFLNDQPTEWSHHAKLPMSSLVHAFGKLDFFV